jgi:AcrR family transcriptional regulator
MSETPPERSDRRARSAGGTVPRRRAAPARRSQEERRDASKKGLLKAALALIAEHGFRGTSFQAIAERAGYSPSLVSHRFGSKDGLLAELVRRMLHRWGADVREFKVEGRRGAAALSAIAHAHRQALEQTPEAVRAMYMLLFESLIDAPTLRREFAALDGRIRDANAGLLRESASGEIDTEAHAALFLAMLRGITLQWLVHPGSLDLPRVYKALDHLLERGLRS